MFSELTSESAYWLGMLLSDGNVYIAPKGNPEITLTLKDKEHVLKFRDFVGGQRSLYHTIYGTWRYRFNSAEVAEELATYNVLPNKSLTATVPSSLETNPDFWRGMIDGDGCIYVGKYTQVQLVGTEAVCSSFLDYCNSLAPSKASVGRTGENLFQVRICAKKSIEVLLTELYVDSSVSLDRKHAKAILALESVGAPFQ